MKSNIPSGPTLSPCSAEREAKKSLELTKDPLGSPLDGDLL